MNTQSKSINTLAEVHNAQVKKGLETYGKALHPFNGRSAYRDAMEEIVDIAAYVTQLEQERTILKLALESLYGACMRFLDAPDGRAAYPRMRFSEEARSVRDDLGAIGFILNDDADFRHYCNSIAEFHTYVKAMLDDTDEYGGIMPESAFMHVDMADAISVVNECDHPAWDEGWQAGVKGAWPRDNFYFNDDLCRTYTAGELFEFSDIWESGRKVGFKRHRQYIKDQLESALVADETDAENYYKQGFDAAVAGTGRDGCPYDVHTMSWREWCMGWEEGRGLWLDQRAEVALVMDGDIDEGSCMGDTATPCARCGKEMEWDEGDSSVGWPGRYQCPVCDGEGYLEDEV